MTDFEQTKAELHKLIDGLDEEKCKCIGVLKFGFTTIEAIKFELEKCQKQPTLEEQLQELGFTRSDTMPITALHYQINEKQEIIELYFTINGIRAYNLMIPIFEPERIIKCAKFLKELRDE